MTRQRSMLQIRLSRMALRLLAVDVVQVGGLAAVVAGVWLIYEPAALIAGGLGVVLWGQGRGGGGDDRG